MKEVECIIRNSVIIDDNYFYLVEELDSKEIHYIPTRQVDILLDVQYGKPYFFIKEYNNFNNKTYLSLILPKYKLGNELEFNIIDKKIINDKLIFELESEYEFPLTVVAFLWQKEVKKIKCKVIGYRKGKPILRNVDISDCPFPIGELRIFSIKDFGKYVDNKGVEHDAIIVELQGFGEIKVKAGIWHKASFWNFSDIKCEIIGISKDGSPKLRINDNRHPLYSKGKTYSFSIKGFKKKLLNSGSEITVILLSDKTEFIYEVLALPNQENKLSIGQKIDCEVIDINTKLHLKQVNIDDPFFYEFEEIINDQEIKKKYFDKYLNENNSSNLKLKSQYIQRSGFWVFTYCNYILSQIKLDAISRKNLNEILNIIDLHTKFEEWILKKGIIRAINNEDERKITKIKTRQIIENNQSEIKIIKYILEYKENTFFEEQKREINFKEIYYYVIYSFFNSINEEKLLSLLYKINDSFNIVNTENYHYINKLNTYIQHNLSIFKSTIQQVYFILSKDLNEKQKQNIKKLINWLLVQYILKRITKSTVESNVLLAKIFRYYTFLLSDYNSNKKLLLNAFFIISNPNKIFDLPLKITNGDIILTLNNIPDNPNKGKSINFSNKYHLSKIKEKHYKGYRLLINDIYGFLPYQNITDPNLKKFQGKNIDWDTNVEITLYCNDFKFFVAKQIKITSEYYYSKNNSLKNSTIINSVTIGTIKNIVEYGIFVNTEYGDGLIHLTKISYDYFDKDKLSSLFKVGDKIPVYVLDSGENTLELSLKHLIATEYEKKYYNLIGFYDYDQGDIYSFEEENINQEENVNNLNFQIELEKGYIFEQYAVLQPDINNKIKYIKFAKAFFSNTKNARSYLLNIYIEYFNSLNILDKLIANYSFEKYKVFRQKILQIKEKVQPKTLENFPESKNLLFFIDILNLFNSQKEEDIERLFNLTINSIEENDILLKAVAKNALANNLIISEINEDKKDELNQFTLKNLKRIREFISQGVLSVRETVEDKLTRELNEKRDYWRKKIAQDEGEKLEFKSTFITPVPDNEKQKIINHLNRQLEIQKDEDKKIKIKKKIEDINEATKNVKHIRNIIIHSALKTICAFANTNGGYLLIGVSDDKKIFGLEQDYNSFKSGKGRDEFGKFFDSKLQEYFGKSFSPTLLEKEFLKFPEGDILIIKVNKSPTEIFLLKDEKGNPSESIYVRNLSSSIKLSGIELVKFIKARLKMQFNDY